MKLPAQWSKVPLHQVAHVQTGLSKSQNRSGPSVLRPYLRVANVQDGYLDLAAIKEIEVPASQVERFSLRNGDVLLTEGGDFDKLGRGSIWNGEIPDCVHQNHVFAVRVVDRAVLLPEFLACEIQSSRAKNYFLSCAKQTTNLASINSSQLKELPVLVPPLPEQRAIINASTTWDTAIQKTEQLIAEKERRLAAIRQKFFARSSREGYVGIRLESLLKQTGELSDGNLPIYLVSVHKGLINQVEHLGRSFSAATTTHYNLVRPGDIVYTKSPTGDFPYGIVKQSSATENAAVSPLYAVYRPSSLDVGTLVDFFFESPINARNYLHPLVQKGAKNTISIGNDQFLKGELALPASPEQIARVSSFIREARAEIALLKKSVAALSTQKRGLMQKLLTGQWRLPVQEEAN